MAYPIIWQYAYEEITEFMCAFSRECESTWTLQTLSSNYDPATTRIQSWKGFFFILKVFMCVCVCVCVLAVGRKDWIYRIEEYISWKQWRAGASLDHESQLLNFKKLFEPVVKHSNFLKS